MLKSYKYINIKKTRVSTHFKAIQQILKCSIRFGTNGNFQESNKFDKKKIFKMSLGNSDLNFQEKIWAIVKKE